MKISIRLREYVVTDNIYTKEEVKSIFSEKLIKYMQSLEEKGVQIIQKNVTINKNKKNWQMNMDFQIVEKTGKNIPIVPQAVQEAGEGNQEAAVLD